MGEIVELVELELEWGWSPQAEAEAVVVVLARCVALLDCLFVCHRPSARARREIERERVRGRVP